MAVLVSLDDTPFSAFAAAGAFGLFFANGAARVRVSIDSGCSWSLLPAPGGSVEPFLALHVSPTNFSIVYGVTGNVFRSDDSGLT